MMNVELSASSAAAVPSKAGFGLTRGGVLVVRAAAYETSPTVTAVANGAGGKTTALRITSESAATLTCNGPTSFGVRSTLQQSEDPAPGSEQRSAYDECWELLYLDQDLLITEVTHQEHREGQPKEEQLLLFWSRASS